MSTKKRNPLSGVEGDKAFAPDRRLKDKLGKEIDLRRDVFTPENIAKTQELIDEAAADFFDDSMEEIDKMVTACAKMETAENPTVLQNEIGMIAQLLKGQAETLGFDLVAEVGNSLANYCRTHQDSPQTATIIVRKHVDTLRVAFHQRLEGRGGAVGSELVESLEKLINKLSTR